MKHRNGFISIKQRGKSLLTLPLYLCTYTIVVPFGFWGISLVRFRDSFSYTYDVLFSLSFSVNLLALLCSMEKRQAISLCP